MSHDDIRAIRHLKHEYCFLIDSGEYDRWADLFTDDGRFVRGNGDTYEGYDELYAFASERFANMFAHSAHIVTNPVIDVDGETATGTWYLLLGYQTANGDTGWTQARYDDRYLLVDDEWRIRESDITSGMTS